MSNTRSPEPLVFSAPLLPGNTSWVQQYFILSRWLTFPVLLLLIFMLIFFHEKLPGTWAVVLLVGIPLNFLLFHYLLARVFAGMEMDKWHTYKLVTTEKDLTLYQPGQEPETFPFDRMEKLRIIYSGYEKAYFPSGKHFSGSRNQLSFYYREKKVELTFRLISKNHYLDLLDLVSLLYEKSIDFEEYNSTSGLPLRSRMLE